VAHVLRLVEHVGVIELALPPAPRVLYLLEGAVSAGGSAGALETWVRIAAGNAWHGTGPRAVTAEAGARVLHWELLRQPTPGAHGARVLLEHPIALDARQPYLMRCDRVDFEPGGVALPHGHRGGGIRCLLQGALDVTVGAAAPRRVRPGQAWFESGREPVMARASELEPTSFIRCSIQPREIQGRSSIVYVDPADAERSRPRTYTVFVDDPIELP
jgi:quercetin dioxygenase-like cupin family protein